MSTIQKIEPLAQNIVVIPHKEENKTTEKITETGFIISKKTNNQNQPQYGKIIAIGPDVKNMKIDEIVLFKEFIPAKFVLDNKTFLIINEKEILAKLI
ncbi:TPA: hypothetical protein EYP45_04650 [Candidatus Peregrinibacteria bacterium]|nr:hypothetical protein [Candidatus Peregrinibacteria bacterium]HIQ57752.1 hypothetical protein [Candidatus Gracilibacteria bacterium]